MKPKPERKKFIRAGRPGERRDDIGTVAVTVTLRRGDGTAYSAKGNIVRVLTIKNAKVSEVFEAIEKSLF